MKRMKNILLYLFILLPVILVLLFIGITIWSEESQTDPDPTPTQDYPDPTPTQTNPDPVLTQSPPAPEKPVIYLYPDEVTDVTVALRYEGVLDFTYPAYDGGWSVTAYPDGKIINHADGREYSYLYWEGHIEGSYDLDRGFVVRGEDTLDFLQEKLAYMGLLPREYNEFIVYWLPQIQNNAYNLISFQTDTYDEMAALDILPEPDSILRVFMVAVPLEEPIVVPEQEFEPFRREGFTVVEWGGDVID